MFGRKTKKIKQLEKRVEELEFRICKGKHNYFLAGEEQSLQDYRNGMCDIATTEVYMCENCGKIKKVFKGYH